MIAVDTSAFIAYLEGKEGQDIQAIDEAIEFNVLLLPPVVLSELLSDPTLSKHVRNNIGALPILHPKPGYWERAGQNRAKLLAKKLKARLADTLIAQSCIDYSIPLITRDNDFRHFQMYCKLKIAL